MKQAETAAKVYRDDIVPTLHDRQLFIREHLVAFIDSNGYQPTASELLRFIAAKYTHRSFDPNSVRPRLTELSEHGWVTKSEKRTCNVSGKTCLTWAPATPRPPAGPPVQQSLSL